MLDTRVEMPSLIQQLPSWRSHKIVNSAKITAITLQDDGTAVLVLSDETMDDLSIIVDQRWIEKHDAAVGGYFVVYSDEYASFSPETPFIGGYSRV